MYYIEGYDLEFHDYTTVYDMYPNLLKQDIQPAAYRKENGFVHRPDICALPPPLTGTDLLRANIHHSKLPKTIIRDMTKANRLFHVSRLKQELKVYLPFQMEMERKFRECIIGAYSQRRFALSDGTDIANREKLYSLSRPISTSVPDISLIGTAGTGKSSAVRMMLDRYPSAIYHRLPDGKAILQIPFLELTAYNDRNIKALFLDMAAQIDRITGQSYARDMSKYSVQRMELVIGELIQLYHVAILIIDEIQLSKDKAIFDHLLRLTACHGVSVMLIGTEDAVEMLNKNEWFARRFSHLGRICSDMSSSNRTVQEAVIKQVWENQCLRELCPCNKDILDFLISESGGNIDLLTSIFITAQYMVIESEDSKHPAKFDLPTFKKAASMFPIAKQLILNGASLIEAAYIEERNKAVSVIERAAQAEKQKEIEAMNAKVPDISNEKAEMLTDVIWRVTAVTEGVTESMVERTYLRLTAKGIDFRSMTAVQRAQVLIAAINSPGKDKTSSIGIEKMTKKGVRGTKKKDHRNKVPAEFERDLLERENGTLADMSCGPQTACDKR